MADAFTRTASLFGDAAMKKLADSRVAVFGLGGVGGYAVEGLVRSGIGALDLIDPDSFSETNLNRQLLATRDTVGRQKTAVAAERCAAINPACTVRTYPLFYLPDTADQLDLTDYDYIVDAIDTVTGKLTLIEHARAAGIPIISCLGTGNKLDAAALEVADISETAVCPLARILRKELKKRGIDRLKVVYSREMPRHADPGDETPPEGRRDIPGTCAFVPAVAGMLLAGCVVRDLTGI